VVRGSSPGSGDGFWVRLGTILFLSELPRTPTAKELAVAIRFVGSAGTFARDRLGALRLRLEKALASAARPGPRCLRPASSRAAERNDERSAPWWAIPVVAASLLIGGVAATPVTIPPALETTDVIVAWGSSITAADHSLEKAVEALTEEGSRACPPRDVICPRRARARAEEWSRVSSARLVKARREHLELVRLLSEYEDARAGGDPVMAAHYAEQVRSRYEIVKGLISALEGENPLRRPLRLRPCRLSPRPRPHRTHRRNRNRASLYGWPLLGRGKPRPCSRWRSRSFTPAPSSTLTQNEDAVSATRQNTYLSGEYPGFRPRVVLRRFFLTWCYSVTSHVLVASCRVG
jgi:hypothetical protein